MEFLSKTPNIDFMGKGKWAMLLSALLIAATIYIWFQLGDRKYGTDYIGGYEFVFRFQDDVKVDSGELRAVLERAGFQEAVVQSYGSAAKEFRVRLPAAPAAEASPAAAGAGKAKPESAEATVNKVYQALDAAYPGKYEKLANTFIGPTIGSELQRKAWIATILSLVGILLYITWRFEFAFALGAVVAVFHDVLVSLGIYLFAGHTLNMMSLAAMLTVIGYSVNDTIVIFDRMREEIFKRKDYELVPLMNECVNAMLSRTIITSVLTFFATLSLLLFGGGAIEDLSLFLCVGVITGSYSTIFIASPVVLAWENLRSRASRKAAAAK